jgi:hypothetical protein
MLVSRRGSEGDFELRTCGEKRAARSGDDEERRHLTTTRSDDI